MSGKFTPTAKRLRKFLTVLSGTTQRLSIGYSGQQASDLIRSRILLGSPCMIARFGDTELTTIVRYLVRDRFRFLDRVLGKDFWWDDGIKREMRDNSGLFPTTNEMMEAFSLRVLEDSSNIDILVSWLSKEPRLRKYLNDPILIPRLDIEPYYHQDPWSSALEGKVVLVIHPFVETIEKQYKKREKLFRDQRILPEFHLKTVKAIQSQGGETNGFANWFDALDSMCEKIGLIDFDVAIIGAGAYGISLASFVKKLGKISIHMAGVSQILFGIRGRRWDEIPFYQNLYNDHWTRPTHTETPKNYKQFDGGPYW